MEKNINRIYASIFRPFKLFKQFKSVSSYRDSDIHLLLVLSPMVVSGMWAFSMMAGLHRQPLISQGFAIFISSAVIIVIAGVMGRGWAWYAAWAVKRFSKIEISNPSLYQIFTCSLTPLILAPLLMIASFSMMMFPSYVELFGFLNLLADKISSWIPLWVLILQWLAFMKYVGLGPGKALLIILVPAILFPVILILLSLLPLLMI